MRLCVWFHTSNYMLDAVKNFKITIHKHHKTYDIIGYSEQPSESLCCNCVIPIVTLWIFPESLKMQKKNYLQDYQNCFTGKRSRIMLTRSSHKLNGDISLLFICIALYMKILKVLHAMFTSTAGCRSLRNSFYFVLIANLCLPFF